MSFKTLFIISITRMANPLLNKALDPAINLGQKLFSSIEFILFYDYR
jgi:hypothetical protein